MNVTKINELLQIDIVQGLKNIWLKYKNLTSDPKIFRLVLLGTHRYVHTYIGTLYFGFIPLKDERKQCLLCDCLHFAKFSTQLN